MTAQLHWRTVSAKSTDSNDTRPTCQRSSWTWTASTRAAPLRVASDPRPRRVLQAIPVQTPEELAQQKGGVRTQISGARRQHCGRPQNGGDAQMDPSLQLRINICFPDSISFYGVDPIARDLLVISHWKKHKKGNTKLKLIQELNMDIVLDEAAPAGLDSVLRVASMLSLQPKVATNILETTANLLRASTNHAEVLGAGILGF